MARYIRSIKERIHKMVVRYLPNKGVQQDTRLSANLFQRFQFLLHNEIQEARRVRSNVYQCFKVYNKINHQEHIEFKRGKCIKNKIN